jgi:hypothetical protein
MSRNRILVLLYCERPHGRPKAARLIDRDECTCDRAAVAYTRSEL